jgi:hypothetical protein
MMIRLRRHVIVMSEKLERLHAAKFKRRSTFSSGKAVFWGLTRVGKMLSTIFISILQIKINFEIASGKRRFVYCERLYCLGGWDDRDKNKNDSAFDARVGRDKICETKDKEPEDISVRA